MTRLEFPYPDAPSPGNYLELKEGIIWLRQVLPFVLNHVNCWYLANEKHSGLLDTGVSTPASKEAMQQHLDQLGLPDELIVTHFHPDHAGLAGWFVDQGVNLHSHETEWGIVRTLWDIADSDYGEFYADWYQRNGIGEEPLQVARDRGNSYKKLVSMPPHRCSYLAQGDVVELGGHAFNVMIGKGHAPAMLMFYSVDLKLLIAADQILPTISPNVSLMPNTPDPDPLSSFIETLQTARQLPADTLVLPSHGLPFYGLHDRIDELLKHHQQRCDQVLDACRTARSASDLFSVLFNRELDAQQLSFALGESLAHTRYLCNLGSLNEINHNGVVQFQTNID